MTAIAGTPKLLRQENEYLRTEVERLQAESGISDGLLADAKAEIERLRSLADDMGQTNIMNQIEIERLQAEIVTERGMEADAWCNQLNVEIERLHVKLEACMQETSDLRDGVTKAIGMEWYGKPGEVRVCPDDIKIIAACERLKEMTRKRGLTITGSAAHCIANGCALASGELQDEIEQLKAAMQKACDLLAERQHGSPTRSAGHNARLCLEAALEPKS